MIIVVFAFFLRVFSDVLIHERFHKVVWLRLDSIIQKQGDLGDSNYLSDYYTIKNGDIIRYGCPMNSKTINDCDEIIRMKLEYKKFLPDTFFDFRDTLPGYLYISGKTMRFMGTGKPDSIAENQLAYVTFGGTYPDNEQHCLEMTGEYVEKIIYYSIPMLKFGDCLLRDRSDFTSIKCEKEGTSSGIVCENYSDRQCQNKGVGTYYSRPCSELGLANKHIIGPHNFGKATEGIFIDFLSETLQEFQDNQWTDYQENICGFDTFTDTFSNQTVCQDDCINDCKMFFGNEIEVGKNKRTIQEHSDIIQYPEFITNGGWQYTISLNKKATDIFTIDKDGKDLMCLDVESNDKSATFLPNHLGAPYGQRCWYSTCNPNSEDPPDTCRFVSYGCSESGELLMKVWIVSDDWIDETIPVWPTCSGEPDKIYNVTYLDGDYKYFCGFLTTEEDDDITDFKFGAGTSTIDDTTNGKDKLEVWETVVIVISSVGGGVLFIVILVVVLVVVVFMVKKNKGGEKLLKKQDIDMGEKV